MLHLLHRPWILAVVQLCFGLPVLLLLMYGIASVGGLISDWLPLALYAYMMIAVLRVLKRALWLEAEMAFLSKGWKGLRGSLVLVFLMYPPIYAMAFAMLCRGLSQDFGWAFMPRDSFWGWLGFGLDNLLEIVLFDVPGIYGLSFSDIQPQSFLARTLVLVFRLSFDFLLLAWLGECLRHALVRTGKAEDVASEPSRLIHAGAATVAGE